MTPSNCITFEGNFKGWNACFLENGYIRLVAVPDIGGRIMAYDLGPYSYFFVDPDLAGKLFTPEENQGDGSLAAWKNYGGDKTWPSPQGWDNDQQWHGPPDPVLDTGRYVVNEMSSDGDMARVRMTSPPDQRTGIQIERQFTLKRDTSRVRVDLAFKNISNKPVRWSIWDVAQLRAEKKQSDGSLTYDETGVVTVPLNPNSKFPRGYNVMFGDEDNPQWQADPINGLMKASYQWEIGKIGIDTPGNWIAFSSSHAGFAFVERFNVEAGAEYPDDGVAAEIWTVGAGEVGNLNYAGTGIYLMEAEVLGPLKDIAPGEATTFTMEWAVCRATGPVLDVTEAGAIFENLKIHKRGEGFVQLTGQFGVFDMGSLGLAWYDTTNKVLQTTPLGDVDPLTAISFDRVCKLPENAAHVQLYVKAVDGKQYLLAEAAVESDA